MKLFVGALFALLLVIASLDEVTAKRKAPGQVQRKQKDKYIHKDPRIVFFFPGFWKCMGDQICAKWYNDPDAKKSALDDSSGGGSGGGKCDDKWHCYFDGYDRDHPKRKENCEQACDGADGKHKNQAELAYCDRPDCKDPHNFHICYCQTKCWEDGMEEKEEKICQDITCPADGSDDYRCMRDDERTKLKTRRRIRLLQRIEKASRRGDEYQIKKLVRHLQSENLMDDPAEWADRPCTGNTLDYFCRALHAPVRCTYYCLTNGCNSKYMDMEAEYREKKESEDERRFMKRMLRKRYGVTRRRRKTPRGQRKKKRPGRPGKKDDLVSRCFYLLGIPVIAPFYIGCWLADIFGMVLFT